jgi:hypothetical protein
MHYGVIGQMGERFILYRIGGEDPFIVGKKAQAIVGRESEMRDEIRSATHEFIDRFQDLDDVSIDMADAAINDAIVSLACIVAMGRCPVQRGRSGGDVLYKPAPEGPARLTKQLTQLAMALAIVRDTNVIDLGVLTTIRKVARDLMPAYRLSIVEYLWEQQALSSNFSWIITKTIADGAGMVPRTALRTLEDLMLIGITTRSRAGDYETAPYRWALTRTAERLIEGGGLFGKL